MTLPLLCLQGFQPEWEVHHHWFLSPLLNSPVWQWKMERKDSQKVTEQQITIWCLECRTKEANVERPCLKQNEWQPLTPEVSFWFSHTCSSTFKNVCIQNACTHMNICACTYTHKHTWYKNILETQDSLCGVLITLYPAKGCYRSTNSNREA